MLSHVKANQKSIAPNGGTRVHARIAADAPSGGCERAMNDDATVAGTITDAAVIGLSTSRIASWCETDNTT